jgi:hypothetical protein
MSCFSDEVKKIFEKWEQSELCEKLEAAHADLVTRRVDAIEYGNPNEMDERKRANLNCQVLTQALLNRSERLIVSSGAMLLESSV